MSFNILGDHGLDINITILKMVRRLEGEQLVEEIEQAIPIDVSAISSLKIEDNLMRSGMFGAIEINNQTSILDQLGIATKSSDDLYISVLIKDDSLEKAGLKPYQSKIDFLGLIEKTVTGSANYQDNVIIFQFEEAFIAEMRHTTWESFVRNSKLDGKQTVTDLVRNYYNIVWKQKNDTIASDNVIVDVSEGEPTIALPIVVNTKHKAPDKEESFYDVFKRTLNRTNAASVEAISFFGADVRIPKTGKQLLPSFRFTNGVDGKRVMKFKPYYTDEHREFIEEMRLAGIQGTKINFSNVYTEKFTCGPLAQIKGALDPNTNWHNSIEGETVTRPDVGTLREEVWTNYLVINAQASDFDDDFDITDSNSEPFLYADVVKSFIEDELALKGDAGVNLPLIDADRQPKQYIFAPNDSTNPRTAIVNELNNRIKLSFINVNEKISFSCKGAIYRTPGKFIWIERSGNSESLLEKIWYVNSVEHSIIDGEYVTEIIANRVFGENTLKAFDLLANNAKIIINGTLNDRSKDQEVRSEAEAVIETLETESAPPEPKKYYFAEEVEVYKESDEYKDLSAQEQNEWNKENDPAEIKKQNIETAELQKILRERDPEGFTAAFRQRNIIGESGQNLFKEYIEANRAGVEATN